MMRSTLSLRFARLCRSPHCILVSAASRRKWVRLRLESVVGAEHAKARRVRSTTTRVGPASREWHEVNEPAVINHGRLWWRLLRKLRSGFRHPQAEIRGDAAQEAPGRHGVRQRSEAGPRTRPGAPIAGASADVGALLCRGAGASRASPQCRRRRRTSRAGLRRRGCRAARWTKRQSAHRASIRRRGCARTCRRRWANLPATRVRSALVPTRAHCGTGYQRAETGSDSRAAEPQAPASAKGFGATARSRARCARCLLVPLALRARRIAH